MDERSSTISGRRLPLPARSVNRLGAALTRVGLPEVSLEEADLAAAAIKRTGLVDFGTDEWHEPLRVLLRSLDEEARLTVLGRWFAKGMVEGALENRLRLQADWTAHPEILEERIERPLYVLGLPRTGTTILQNLLALDPGSRSLLGWEAARPSPPPERATFGTDPRIAGAQRTQRLLDYLAPEARALHPVAPQLPTECVVLFGNSFASLDITTIHWVPSYLDWCLEADFGPHYAYYKRQLQQLQWRCPGDRWLLKSPAHLFFVDDLVETFPDACIVQTHRDPVRAVTSYCSLAAVLHGIGSDTVDLRAIGSVWPQVWAEGLERAAAARERVDPARFFDVHYDEFVADPPATVRRIYDHFELPFDPAMADRMRRFLAEHPQHVAGVHRYAPEDFGLDAEAEAQRFAAYRARFAVRAERLS